MLTRIISGTVISLIVAIIAVCHYIFKLSAVTGVFLAVLAATAIWEMLKNTGIVKKRGLIYAGMLYSAGVVLFRTFAPDLILPFSVIYIIFIVAISLVYNGDITVSDITAGIAFPLVLSYSFGSVYTVLSAGIFPFLMLINFSMVCDCGAYFAGVTFGRHKLCPDISPKKTIEGSIGGILVSTVVTVILTLCFGLGSFAFRLLLITPVMCGVGIAGDLFASVIKRQTGIKDYGNIIPGHGGIIDRFDSILLIAPALDIMLTVLGVK